LAQTLTVWVGLSALVDPGVSPEARPDGERSPSEAERCSQELAALVEHGLFDDLVGPQQQRVRDASAARAKQTQWLNAPGCTPNARDNLRAAKFIPMLDLRPAIPT
jgi:hypothetical protein